MSQIYSTSRRGENSSLHGFLHRNQGLMHTYSRCIRAEMAIVLDFQVQLPLCFEAQLKKLEIILQYN